MLALYFVFLRFLKSLILTIHWSLLDLLKNLYLVPWIRSSHVLQSYLTLRIPNLSLRTIHIHIFSSHGTITGDIKNKNNFKLNSCTVIYTCTLNWPFSYSTVLSFSETQTHFLQSQFHIIPFPQILLPLRFSCAHRIALSTAPIPPQNIFKFPFISFVLLLQHRSWFSALRG